MFHMKHNLRSGNPRRNGRNGQLGRTMTQQTHNSTELVGNGFTFEAALNDLLTAAVHLITPATDDRLPDVSVRVRAEASTREALVGECLDAVNAQIDEFDAQPIAITLDGLRPIDGGFRAWASLYLDPDRDGSGERFELWSQPIVRISQDRCQITVAVRRRTNCDCQSTRVD
jgi:hypothetical protein